MVAGFAFDDSMQNVVLISKQQPKWQKNKLNGVGGKFKESKDVHLVDTMQREFYEEAGVKTALAAWCSFATISGHDWLVEFFYIRNSRIFADAHTTTDEKIVKISVSELRELPTISNLQWLIPLAIDCELTRTISMPVGISYTT